VRQTSTVITAIAAISEHAWQDIDYPAGGVAQVAETMLGDHRLVVRRTRLVGPQATLWPDWRHHAFVTDRAGDPVTLDADHRRHAVCELAIRDLKDGAGLRHCPSGVFLANAAWLVLTTLAHNLVRWVAAIGLGTWPGGRQDPAAPPACRAWPAHSLSPPAPAASATRLALGTRVPASPYRAANPSTSDLTSGPSSHPAAALGRPTPAAAMPPTPRQGPVGPAT
jgi:hypothetical protein